MTDFFGKLKVPPPDPVFLTKAQFEMDRNPKKVFLTIGAYRDAYAKPYVLQTLKKAEAWYQQQLVSGKETKEYDSITGYKPFCEASVKLLLGEACPSMKRVAACVGLSGTGSLTLASHVLAAVTPHHTPVLISNPTWPNHDPIFRMAGFHNVRQYRYFDAYTQGLDFEGMCNDLWDAPDGAIVVLHVCSHNPTGVDPTDEQWQKISDLCKMKKFRVIFDSAYQGYASGDLNRDAYSVRLFVKNGLEVFTCQSFSKNMGMYGDRIGCCSAVCSTEHGAAVVRGLFEKTARPLYSNPPRRPSRVAHRVLTDPVLRSEWETELKGMADRIISMRQLLFDELRRLGTPGKWDHIVQQIGMFSYLGLTREQCKRIVKEYSIYVMMTGRISVAGLTEENTPRLAKAIDTVVRGTKKAKL